MIILLIVRACDLGVARSDAAVSRPDVLRHTYDEISRDDALIVLISLATE